MQEAEHLVNSHAHSARREGLISLLNVSAQPKYVFDNWFGYFDQQYSTPGCFRTPSQCNHVRTFPTDA